MKHNKLQPDPELNISRNISWTIIASSIITFVYYLPTTTHSAKVISLAVGRNEFSRVDLAIILEKNAQPEQFEIKESQAKLLNECSSKLCYIKAEVINGLIPLVTNRKIISFEILENP